MIKDLSRDEIKLLELYSDNLTYEEIQKRMATFSLEDYSGKRLNHAMSELRKKLKYNTQFAMGFQYAATKLGVENLSEVDFIDLYNKHKGINIGIGFASLFWFVIWLTFNSTII